jgi:hypothetical protein
LERETIQATATMATTAATPAGAAERAAMVATVAALATALAVAASPLVRPEAAVAAPERPQDSAALVADSKTDKTLPSVNWVHFGDLKKI